jgi:large subunit ribosomal protein L17
MRGRKLGRNSSHRKAMFRNMACSLIRSVRVDEDDDQRPKVPGRIVTTLAKAKELRPIVEKLVTLARKAAPYEVSAKEFATSAERNTAEWKTWRQSEQWNKWNQAIAPAVTMRRRAFAKLRDNQAVDILFDELAERFEDRPGGYTRVIRLATVRLGDAGRQALIEFVGERDRVRRKRKAPVVTDEEQTQDTPAATDSETAESETAEASEQTAEEAPAETSEAGGEGESTSAADEGEGKSE